MEKRMMFIAMLLASVLAFGSASAQTSTCLQTGAQAWYCNQINQATASIWSSWEPVALIAVILAFFVAAILFMASIITRSEKLRRFAIGEIYEAGATSIMVVAFMFVTATLFGIIPAFVTGPVDPYALSLAYISSTLQASQLPVISLYNVIMVDSYYGSQEIIVNLLPEEQGVTYGATTQITHTISSIITSLAIPITQFFIAPADNMMSLIVEGMMALTAEFYMILFFMYVAIPVFLIPGVIFRAILPLRSVGGMLIAIAIAFYLVMPILFSVEYYFTNISVISHLNAASAAITTDSQGTLAQTNAANQNAPLELDVSGLTSDMGAYFLSVLFYPALILGITYFTIRTMADFIGGVSKMTGKLGLL